MAQHDFVISNGSGKAVREDIDSALKALVSNNSGNGEPSPTYAHQFWADTNAGLLKIRNATNSAWITLRGLDGSLLNGGPLAGFRNLLINANPIINQRGYVSGTPTSEAYQYTLDRWIVVTSGQSISWTDAANVRTVTAPAGGVEQVIEGASILSGTYTLNWTGTATAIVAGNAVAKGGTVTLTGGTNTTVRFSGGTFSRAQLEPGPVATPFEQRPIGTELSLCQRYYETGRGLLAGHMTVSTGTHYYIPFAVTKRAAPSVGYGIITASNVSTYEARDASVNGLRWYCITAVAGSFTWDGTWIASAEL